MRKFWHRLVRVMKRFARRCMSGYKPWMGVTMAVLLAVAVVVGSVGTVLIAVENKERERILALAEPYELERASLERELASFDAKLAAPIPGGATLTTMFVGADEAIYVNVYTIFRELNALLAEDLERALRDAANMGEAVPTLEAAYEQKRMRGSLALSPGSMPGMAGNMTLAQFEELRAEGWSVAIYVTEEDTADLAAYIAEARDALAAVGITDCDTVCFDCEVYDTGYDPDLGQNVYDDILLDCGISSVVDRVYEGDDILSNDLSSDLWRVKADGWSLAKSKGSATENYSQLVRARGAMTFVFEIWHGANRESPTHYLPYDSDVNFKRMLTRFSESVVNDELYIDSPDAARENYAAYTADYDMRREIYEPQRQAIIARLSEVNAALNEIYSG